MGASSAGRNCSLHRVCRAIARAIYTMQSAIRAMTMNKMRLATAWLGGCSGCHMSFLDLDAWLIDLARQVDIVYSPLADLKTYPDQVDVALVEGAVANEEHVHMIRVIRE